MRHRMRPLPLLAAILLLLGGCCGRGLWYSSPSRSCALEAPDPAAAPA